MEVEATVVPKMKDQAQEGKKGGTMEVIRMEEIEVVLAWLITKEETSVNRKLKTLNLIINNKRSNLIVSLKNVSFYVAY